MRKGIIFFKDLNNFSLEEAVNKNILVITSDKLIE